MGRAASASNSSWRVKRTSDSWSLLGGADFGDFGSVEEAVGDDVEELAGLGAQDAGEVDGLLAGEGGVGGMAGLRGPGVGDEAAAS